jgi:hypothetical protein
MDQDQLVAKPEPETLEDALARSLRAIMAMSGRPSRREPGYYCSPSLYARDMRKWQEAERALAHYDACNNETE